MRPHFYSFIFFVLLLPFNSLQSQDFTEVALESGIDHLFHVGDYLFGGGAAVIDFDKDGWEDVFIAGGANADKLYKNNGDGTFTNVLIGSGLEVMADILTIGAIAGDLDNDGDKDLFVSTRSPIADLNVYVANFLFLNNGDGTFSDISEPSNIGKGVTFSASATLGDINNDGYLDIYVGNFLGLPMNEILGEDGFPIQGGGHPGSDNYLYINNGDMTFTDIAEAAKVTNGGTAWSVVFSDYDNDHDVDLYLANDFGPFLYPNALYRNNHPESRFSNVSIQSNTNVSMLGMGIAVGDYNEDGWLDYYVTNMSTNVLLKNNQDGTFDNVIEGSGCESTGWEMIDKSTGEEGHVAAIGWGANFFDYDHDSYLDLFVANGSLNPLVEGTTTIDTSHNANELYRNKGDGTFEWVGNSGLGHETRGRGSVTFDYDKDGDLDILVVVQNNFEGYTCINESRALLYRNDTENESNWLQIKTIGKEQNRDGMGARLRITMGDRSLIREVDGGSSHLSCNSPLVHFGLGTHTEIDELEVTWIGGKTQTFSNIPANQVIEIKEDENDWMAVGIEENAFSREIKIYPNPLSTSNRNGLILQIDDFNSGEKLQWEMLSLDSRVLQSVEVRSAQQLIATNGLESGMYYGRLKQGAKVIGVEKVVVY